MSGLEHRAEGRGQRGIEVRVEVASGRDCSR